ncbi:helix-turn-helix domain-containing protein [Microbacterium sp. NPDC078428]|uniref:helix-turn-helix domain-containing protein n=1 Tax=Microbacterium sp. NPDC078428 TaxID=3364190 RepID=UPI0037CA7BFC
MTTKDAATPLPGEPTDRPYDRGTMEDGSMHVDGGRIRELRKASHRTLAALAADTSLSVSFLSLVERNLSQPSFDSLMRIAGALNVPMKAIVRDEAGADSASITQSAQGSGVYRDRYVTPETARTVQVLEAVLDPGRHSRVHSYSHPEDEECIFVLEGELEFTLEDTLYRLGAGESLLIDPRLPHSYANTGTRPARWLWISAKSD